MADPSSEDFEFQLKQEQEEQWKRDNGYIYTDPNDGTMYEWDPEKQAWFPRVDEDFLAMYHASYGVSSTQSEEAAESSQAETQPSTIAPTTEEKPSTNQSAGQESPGARVAGSNGAEGQEVEQASKSQEEVAQIQPQQLYRYQKMQMKRKAEQKTWFEVDPTKNTNVYVSGLPDDITEEEFVELMSKYGIIMVEEETEKPKIKLYLDAQGRPKGDGRCCFLKRESVDLAIQLLDESEVRGSKVHVEVATFTLKGEYRPPQKKKKNNKKKKGNVQQKLLDWRPEKKFQQRKRNEQVIILKNAFHPDEFEEDAVLITEIRDDLKEECSRYGEVKKVMIFDRHPEGVASVKFKDVENADACINALNGRWFAQRKLEVFTWDGKTDYKIEETDKEREERLKKWEEFLKDDDEEEEKEKTDGAKLDTDGAKLDTDGAKPDGKTEEERKADRSGQKEKDLGKEEEEEEEGEKEDEMEKDDKKEEGKS